MSTEHKNALYGERKKGRPRTNMATVMENDLDKKRLLSEKLAQNREDGKKLSFQIMCYDLSPIPEN